MERASQAQRLLPPGAKQHRGALGPLSRCSGGGDAGSALAVRRLLRGGPVQQQPPSIVVIPHLLLFSFDTIPPLDDSQCAMTPRRQCSTLPSRQAGRQPRRRLARSHPGLLGPVSACPSGCGSRPAPPPCRTCVCSGGRGHPQAGRAERSGHARTHAAVRARAPPAPHSLLLVLRSPGRDGFQVVPARAGRGREGAQRRLLQRCWPSQSPACCRLGRTRGLRGSQPANQRTPLGGRQAYISGYIRNRSPAPHPSQPTRPP